MIHTFSTAAWVFFREHSYKRYVSTNLEKSCRLVSFDLIMVFRTGPSQEEGRGEGSGGGEVPKLGRGPGAAQAPGGKPGKFSI